MKKLLTILFLSFLTIQAYSQSVSPIIENVTNYGNGKYVVFYGYNNTSGSVVNIPVNNGVGVKNYFTPGSINRGQPTTFQMGRQISIWSMEVAYGTSLTWNLTGRTATYATKNVVLEVTDNQTIMPPVGSLVTYTIKYANNETSGLSNGRITDTIPAGTEFVSATNGGVASNGVITWSVGSMNGQTGGSVSFTVKVVPLESLTITYKNVAYFSCQFNGANYRAFGMDENVYNPETTKEYDYIAAFEDLKGSGWNDWDVNDFVVGMKEKVTYDNSLRISKIVFEYEALARGSAFVNAFLHRIKVPGTSTVSLVVKDSNGTVIPGLSFSNQQFNGLVEAKVFPNTHDALPPQPGRTFTNVETNQVGVVKGYTAVLTINTDINAVNSGNYGPENSRPYLINELNKQIDIASLDGTLGNTQNVDNNVEAGTPLYGYFLDLAYKLPYDWKWPLEGPPSAIWNSFPKFVDYTLSSQSVNTDWYNFPDLSKVWTRRVVTDSHPFANKNKAADFLSRLQNSQNQTDELILNTTAGSFFASPKLADIDNDGKLEILIGSYDKKFHAYKNDGTEVNGFPVTTNGLIRSTAAVNLQGSKIIAFGSEDGKLYAVDKNGANLGGFPVQTPKAIKSSPMIVDLNNDGTKEIVVLSGDGKIYAYLSNGTLVNGFPVQVQNTEDNFGNIIIMPSPAAADLDGNGNKEIIIGTLDKTLKVINPNGSVRFTKTLDSAVYSSPLVTKINSTTYRIVVTTAAGTIYEFDNAGNEIVKKNFGAGFISSPVLADLDKSGTPQLIAATITGEIYKLNASTLSTMWQLPTGQQIYSSPVIADVDGDNYLDIVYGGQSGFLLPLTRFGALVDTTTIAAIGPFDSWIISTCAVGDIDKDGKVDLVAASMDKNLKAFNLPATNVNTKVWWSSFGNDLGNTRVADSLTSVGIVNNSSIADKYSLSQNYPNPFNPTTKISFSIPKAEFVTVKVFDMTGKEVALLVNQNMKSGTYEYSFNGSMLSSGIYFYQIITPNFTETKKMTLVK